MFDVLSLYENLWKNCSCQPINLNKKCKKGIEYKLDFYNKYITWTGLAIKKVKYGHEFFDWFKNESQIRIPSDKILLIFVENAWRIMINEIKVKNFICLYLFIYFSSSTRNEK